jgi:hypothetical protein
MKLRHVDVDAVTDPNKRASESILVATSVRPASGLNGLERHARRVEFGKCRQWD